MGVPHDIDARRYYRVAYQRLEDGTLMLEKLDRPKPAIYLTGYAVECIMKALLLVLTPVGERPDVIRSFRGPGAHDLLRLRDRIVQRGVVLPAAVSKELAYVSIWSVDLRYDPGGGDAEDARRFIKAAEMLIQWANNRM